MCIYASYCKPNEQMKPSKEHPYGTEWVFCRKDGINRHCHGLSCINHDYNNKIELDENKVVELYKQGYSLNEIVTKFNSSIFTIRKILMREKIYKVKKSKKYYLTLYKNEILTYYDSSIMITYEDVAEFVHKNYGIEISSVGVGVLIKQWKEEENGK